MMLVDSITFSGNNSQVRVYVDNARAVINVDNNQQLVLSINQLKALQNALARVVEGR